MEPNEKSDVQAAVDAGEKMAATEDRIVWVNGIPVACVPPGFQMQVLENYLAIADARADVPAARVGTAKFTELASFIDHVNRMQCANTVVFADTESMNLMAVYDYHPGGAAGLAAWCRHRAVYDCPKSDPWMLWNGVHNQALTQEQFGDLIEEHIEDLVGAEGYPKPLDLLAMSRDLRLQTKGVFAKSIDRVSGDYSLTCKQETESTSTPIPRAFLLGIPVFEGGDLYRVEARMRVKIIDGAPRIGFVLHRANEIAEEAFRGLREQVATKCGVLVLAGSPEA